LSIAAISLTKPAAQTHPTPDETDQSRKQFLGHNFIPAKSNHPRRMHVNIRYTQKNQQTHLLKKLPVLSTQQSEDERVLPTGRKAAALCWKISIVADEKL
jgi:hypothetical protein